MALFGLIGFPLGNSNSSNYFNKKFSEAGLPHRYENFPIEKMEKLEELIHNNPELRGLNVTRPYKSAVLPYLSRIEDEAAAVGAVNCIRIEQNGDRTGYNTDIFGFRESLKNFLHGYFPQKALVIGNGGAAAAVCHVLKTEGILFTQASRNPKQAGEVILNTLSKHEIARFDLLINTTPVGMYPEVDRKLNFDFEGIHSGQYCYDLIYLPEIPTFLEEAQKRGAQICNGLQMLHLQADKAWEIWLE